MKNKIALKPRFASIAARCALVAVCAAAAPAALATNTQSAPEGAGYLLSYNGHHYQGGSFGDGNGVGGWSSRQDVPEPATWGMFGLGLAMIGMGAAARRRRSERS
ncbi:PEP-CTERM sorting domain-containing protein [Salinisphaera sp. SPP-AMP-43]|uniref:PEP-CTERM sorting domain-containing protein n=1 Tax=Salinisphaera sp. SPP-AMP-43 TaxID=3121288 RepID=UPI003C6DE63F